jgi:hypothetical protein
MALRHYSEYTPREGMAVDAAYKARAEAVKAKTREIATRPVELLYLVDSEVITTLIADLMREFYQKGDVLAAAYTLCKTLDYQASVSAELEVSEVDEEAIQDQMRGDR